MSALRHACEGPPCTKTRAPGPRSRTRLCHRYLGGESRDNAPTTSGRPCWRLPAALGEGSSPMQRASSEAGSIGGLLNACYKFTRPHTMLGTTVSVLSVSLMAMQGHPWTPEVVNALGVALTTALLANVSIVGLNQVFDVDIDKVNKPYLPLASGEISISGGIALVVATGVASLVLGVAAGSPPLLATLVASHVLGVLYSADLPFMRWKRFPWLAAGCILAVRALIVQLGFYYHIKLALGTTLLTLTPPLLFTMNFMLMFSVVIALFKDIPDIKGDESAGVRTFSVRFGPSRVMWVCVGLLLAAYAGGMAYGASMWAAGASAAQAGVVVAGHAALGAALWRRAAKTNAAKRGEVADTYMFIWKLFYTEYLLVPLLA